MATVFHSEYKSILAIAGATGNLGTYITEAVLADELRPQFAKIILLSRTSSSESNKLARWEDQGATVIKYEEDNLKASLADVDVLINALGGRALEAKEKLIQALAGSKVKLYLPSEYGVDHGVHDFAQDAWDFKRKHVQTAQQLIPSAKICRVYCGMFLEGGVKPWYMLDIAKGKFESVGSAKTPITFTSMADVGRAVARVALMPPEQVPDILRLAGTTVSISEIASLMEKAGANSIDVVEINLQAYKDKTVKGKSPMPPPFLRFIMGEGNLDHSETGMGNSNELVNPGQNHWRWKTMADWAEETKGKATL